MFDRFDKETKLVLEQAREAALEMNHGHIRSEHILLGLLADPHITLLLRRLGLTKTDVFNAVDAQVPRGPELVLDDILPYAAEARDVLDAALEEMSGYGHTMLRSAHLVLGLVKESDGLGGRVLEMSGMTLDGMRQEVLEYFADLDEGESGAA